MKIEITENMMVGIRIILLCDNPSEEDVIELIDRLIAEDAMFQVHFRNENH